VAQASILSPSIVAKIDVCAPFIAALLSHDERGTLLMTHDDSSGLMSGPPATQSF